MPPPPLSPLQDCAPLAYILDRLVAAEPGGDKECASSCRLLVAAIAACNHSPDAQATLVFEVGHVTTVVTSVGGCRIGGTG